MILSFRKKMAVFAAFSALPAIAIAATPAQLDQARDDALAYLVDSQNPDGSWGKSEKAKVRSTSEVLNVFHHYDVGGLIKQRGLSWLNNAEPYSIDALARQQSSLSDQGLHSNARDQKLEAKATSVGGKKVWGARDKFQFAAVDTALALEASVKHSDGKNIDSSLSYLNALKNSDPIKGYGWGYSRHAKDTSKVLPTAQMLLMYRVLDDKLGTNHLGSSNNIAAANWLAEQQLINGGFGEVAEAADRHTALAVKALGFALPHNSTLLGAYDAGQDYLLSRIGVDGSVDDNAFKTAQLLSALSVDRQVALDSDNDGIPNAVEIVLGKNPNEIDTDYLNKGNGSNTHINTTDNKVAEALINAAFEYQLITAGGAVSLVSGRLPTGVSLKPLEHKISGVPTEEGHYPFSYQYASFDGTEVLTSMMLRVVGPYTDTDGDGIPSAFELEHSSVMDSFSTADADLDSDGDGVTNIDEYLNGGSPTLTDTDGDGLTDAQEITLGTRLYESDTDGDGFSDYDEYIAETDPNIPLDTDNDGLPDHIEIAMGLPIDNPDFDGDGKLDGEDDNPFFNPAWLIPIISTIL